MIIERPIAVSDLILLGESIRLDETHPDVDPGFYCEPKTMGVVYEDEQGPVMFARFSSVLQINLQFCPEVNKKRIADVLRSQFPSVMERAKMNGYKKITFSSVSQRLRAFCRRYLKFQPSPDEHVLWL